jgi:NADH:ubiquinone oxidoreductase subunit D
MHSPATAEQQPEYVELQAIVARLYGLSVADLTHVLATFPLIPEEVKRCTLAIFSELSE